MTGSNDNRHQLSIDKLVPGGIKPTDRWHIKLDNGLCSRCGKEPPEDDVPLLIWRNAGDDMLRYCEACLGVQREPEDLE